MIPQKRLRKTGISVCHGAPRNPHTLIARACEHITLPGKRNFADVNKAKSHEMA